MQDRRRGNAKGGLSTTRRSATSKVAISLPTELLARIEAARQTSDLDRSSWIQEAARKYLADAEHAERVAQYVRGYDEEPETDDDAAEADAASARLARYLDEEERAADASVSPS